MAYNKLNLKKGDVLEASHMAHIEDGIENAAQDADAANEELENLRTSVIPTPQEFGAVGDGVTDDTTAIKTALARYREVYIPGGTYKITDGLRIRANCSLILAQDTVLIFEMSSGNCISMEMAASIRGNHGIVRAAYGFAGNVIYVSSTLNDNVLAVPPYTKWDPQWKSGRFVTDLNIVMQNSEGFHYTVDGECSGVAVYISAQGKQATEASSTFIWGLNFSGIRIAGPFKHGILMENFNSGWNHEPRIEAVIDSCETGVELRDCNNAFVAAVIQPRLGKAIGASSATIKYAKNGIVLRRSRNTDLSGSRVWDWNANNSLWHTNKEYEHIAMYGNCWGTILNDFLYYEVSSYDIRQLIYTDTPANLEKINILQEPFTRWFKTKDNEPYFFNGTEDRKLAYKTDVDAVAKELVGSDRTFGFTDVLARATDENGNIFEGIGYKMGAAWGSDGKTLTENFSLACTGYIPIQAGQVLRCEGMKHNPGDYQCRTFVFKADKTLDASVGWDNLINNKQTSFINNYKETDNGFEFTVTRGTCRYIKMIVFKSTVINPIISVDEEIKYTYDGYLNEGVNVKLEQIPGLEGFIKQIINETVG